MTNGWTLQTWTWSYTERPFPICATCQGRCLFNSGPNSKMGPTESTCLNHWFKDRFNKNGRILDAALRGFPVYLSECWFRIQVVCELGNIVTGKGRYHLKESWTSWPWEIAPNLNGPPGVFTYPRTTYLTWPFPSIVWLRSGTNMKVENLRSVPTWYKIRWPWSSTAVPFPICVTCPWRSLFNSGPNSKWTWMSPTQSTCLSHWFNNAFNKNREFGMLRTRHDSGVFGMLSTRHEGNPSWTEGSRMLAMFDYMFLRFIRA